MNIDGQHITIVGAGLTGSLLAVMLLQRGARITLLERLSDPRETETEAGRSINLAMAARGLRALKHVGLDEALSDLLCPMPGRILHDKSGDLTFQPYGSREIDINYSVSRAGLNKLLINAAESAGADLRFEQKCVGYDAQSNRLLMQDLRGEPLAYQLATQRIIAADGAGSPIRRSLRDQEIIDGSEQLLSHRYQEITIPATAHGGYAMPPEGLHVWPRGAYMLIALPNPEKDFTATLFMPETAMPEQPSFEWWRQSGKAAAFFAETFPDVPGLVPDLEQQLEQHPLGILGTIRCTPWHFGDRCLLIGDAAHAIVPFHGQGMNAAFEDCIVFDGLIDETEDWSQLFGRFSDARLPNADAIAEMALENYTEMRDVVRDAGFQLRKKLALHLEATCPTFFVSRYSMVMFHADIPYATAQQRGAEQDSLLRQWTTNKQSLEDIDLAACERYVVENLPPLRN
ncbi:MAG: FAD-dependent oxidoreductase [Woeseiaceae bacterium]